jgi:hypothetical protein
MARSSKRRRMSLPSLSRGTGPRIRPAAFGGGLGLLVVAVGLIVIGIGWNGAAGGGGQIGGVTDLRAQLPWLLSGGLLGVALVVFGAALVIVHNARLDRSRLEVKLDELVDAVTRGAAGAGPAPTSAAGLYVAGGSSYHRPDCRLATGRDDVRYVTADEAAAANLAPCRVCQPEVAETLAN